MLSTRTEVGEIGVLANHTPLLAMLQPADLRLHMSESEVKHFAQGEGYLQVHANHALVLVEDCFEPEQIDRAEQEERLRKARGGDRRGARRPPTSPAPATSRRCATSAAPRRSCASPAARRSSPSPGRVAPRAVATTSPTRHHAADARETGAADLRACHRSAAARAPHMNEVEATLPRLPPPR